MQSTSYIVLPIPDHAFFKQTVLQKDFGEGLLKLGAFCTKSLDFAAAGVPFGIAGQPFLTSFQKLLAPFVI